MEADQNAAWLAATNLDLRGVSLAEKPIRLGDGLDYSRDEVRHDVVILNLVQPYGLTTTLTNSVHAVHLS